jgi:hypothetical protein
MSNARQGAPTGHTFPKDKLFPFIVSFCRSCRAPIIWGETAAGKRLSMDATPVPAGKWWIERHRGVPRLIYVPDAMTARQLGVKPEELRVPHFATCPQAPSWRK